MHRLEADRYEAARPLLAEGAAMHASVASLLEGVARGAVWVDDPDHPAVAYALSTEGHYLAGDPDCESAHDGLRRIIPPGAYLVPASPGWEPVLPAVWDNPAARPHRRMLLTAGPDAPVLPPPALADGFTIVPLGPALLEASGLTNHDELLRRVRSWPSTDDFLARGFGFCAVGFGAVASHCVADCVVGRRAEMGVATHPPFRRRGLASAVAASSVAHCLERGLDHLGWHCLESNAGSIAVARGAGFTTRTGYVAFSSLVPAENPGDLDAGECEEWAEHLEDAASRRAEFLHGAGAAWMLAGRPDRARRCLERLAGIPTPLDGRLLDDDAHFGPIATDPAIGALLTAIRERAAPTAT